LFEGQHLILIKFTVIKKDINLVILEVCSLHCET